jgi:hypothetical protein
MCLYHHVLINTNSLLLASSQSTHPSPSHGPEQSILCYCDGRGENVEDTICAERSPTRGMEREHRLVGNFVYLILFVAESFAASSNHVLRSLYPFT